MKGQPSIQAAPGETSVDAERRRRREWHELRCTTARAGIAITNEERNGVTFRQYQGPEVQATLLWLHGGGWAYGEPRFDDAMLTEFALKANLKIVSVDYRLAPENPYPAALTDALTVYQHLIQGTEAPVFIGGASAGATICAGMTLRLRDDSGRLPSALMLICPPLDDEAVDDDEGPLRRSDMNNFWAQYLHGSSIDEYAAPARASSLVGLPHTYIYTTSADPLRFEAWRFAERLVAAGTEATVRFVPGGFHGFEYEAPDALFTRRAVNEWVSTLQAMTANAQQPEPDAQLGEGEPS
ncbi:alpha/beta hydrolase [Arthrobacter sedimenti]|uniref:alpha/beta hydrolase n=1 Tax=Arthrobacter sedimenti TaxID=2694931 RepID=UPI001420D729|nr:alpha/beta hydrolase [Arthrobacter sedimenti]